MEIKICAQCECCWEALDELGEDPREPCPECESTTRKISVQVEDNLLLYQCFGGKRSDQSLPSRRKIKVEFFDGYHWSIALEKYVNKIQIIDKCLTHYNEKVQDAHTKEAIHECTGYLSEHQDHGSAKAKSEEELE